MSQDKNKRQIEVYKAIMGLKAAYVDDVLMAVAPKLGEELPNPSLKRAVRRDLNALVDSHVLNIEYYTPSGELIPPDEEEQHKNTRAKYVIPGGKTPPIRGSKDLEKHGMGVICQDSMIGALCFTEDYRKVPSGAICLSIESGNGAYIHLYIEEGDLPLTVQFSRGYEYTQEFILRKKILEHLSRRSLLILGSNKSISRYRIGEYQSHVILSLLAQKGHIEIGKAIPDSPVSFAKKWDINKSLGLLEQTDETREIPVMQFEWTKISTPVNLQFPALIRVGAIFICAHLKR